MLDKIFIETCCSIHWNIHKENKSGNNLHYLLKNGTWIPWSNFRNAEVDMMHYNSRREAIGQLKKIMGRKVKFETVDER